MSNCVQAHHTFGPEREPFPSALSEHGVEGPPDDEPADFTGASSDFIELGVPQKPPHGVVIDVAVPTCGQRKHRRLGK